MRVRSSGEDLRGGTLGDDDSLFEANDFGVEDEGLFDVVGDGEDGDAVLCGVLLHPREKQVAQRAIDAGEGFVEQDEVRAGTAKARARLTRWRSPPERSRGRRSARRELKEIEGCVGGGSMWLVAYVGGESDVLADGEVREEEGSCGA